MRKIKFFVDVKFASRRLENRCTRNFANFQKSFRDTFFHDVRFLDIYLYVDFQSFRQVVETFRCFQV